MGSIPAFRSKKGCGENGKHTEFRPQRLKDFMGSNPITLSIIVEMSGRVAYGNGLENHHILIEYHEFESHLIQKPLPA